MALIKEISEVEFKENNLNPIFISRKLTLYLSRLLEDN